MAVLMALLIAENTDSWSNYCIGWSHSLALTVGVVLFVWSILRIIAKMLVARLERIGWINRQAGRLARHAEIVSRIIVLSSFGVILTVGGWAKLICVNWHLQHRNVIAVGEICLILPFVILQLLAWHSFYGVNRFVREWLVATQLAEGLAARPVWTRRQYMIFQLRHSMLIVLVPLILIITVQDTVQLLAEMGFASADTGELSQIAAIVKDCVAGLATLMVFFLAPLLLRRIWVTRSLPVGPLRVRLIALCRGLGLKCRDILLWDTHSVLSNAAVMGLTPKVRYVLLSDALVESMPDKQIAAVFGHEAGHVKHHHIVFLVLFILACGFAAITIDELAGHLLGALPLWNDYGKWIVPIALFAGFVTLFGWVSRRFERQADVYAASAIDSVWQKIVPEMSAQADNQQHLSDTAHSTQSKAAQKPPRCVKIKSISPDGAMAIASALERIAMFNGISVSAKSWRHSSIASRIDFLKTMATQEGALPRFQKLVTIIKAAIIVAALAGFVVCYVILA